MKHGIATPCFGSDPEELANLGVRAESAGFDGFFIWDHMLFANDGDGPDIVDPWIVLSLVAIRTSRIRIGTMITPISRRRPWVLARQCVTLDVLSKGRMTLGVGLGSPEKGDFSRFGEVAEPRVRAEMLDEGLTVFDELASGRPLSFHGAHYQLDAVRFTPPAVQKPRIPVWVGGVLPRTRPMSRAARWDGAVPIRFSNGQLVRPAPEDIATARQHIDQRRTSMSNFDIVVWSEVAGTPSQLEQQRDIMPTYADAGATWWIETGRPIAGWWEELCERVLAGPTT